MTRVSVVIPVFNGARYLSECLASVFAQSFAASEVIVVDDGSQDESAAIAHNFAKNQPPAEVIVLSQPNRGPGAARNRGVEQSTGDFLAFLDADDLWAPEKLEWQCAAFEKDPPLNLATGRVLNFISPELDSIMRGRIEVSQEPMPGAHPGAILIRREALLRVGRFSEDLLFGDFIPWFARARDLGLKVENLDRLVMFRRIHESNFSRTNRQNRRDYLTATKRVLDRRRGNV